MFDGLLFSGTTALALDAKGRMSVPSKYREYFEVSDNDQAELVITRSLFDKCLWIYPVSEWEKVVSSLGELPTLTDPLCRTIQRIVLGSAVFCPLDGTGRVLLPQQLRQVALIDKKAYLIGFNNKFELWSESCFDEQRRNDDELLRQASSSMSTHHLLEGLKL
ncbi:MAG: division/cell wall cluster transcriptional repressor MraZ [Succinivibrio sp.]